MKHRSSRHPIRWKLPVLFASLMVGVILITFAANKLLLPRFYERSCKHALVSIFNSLNEAARKGALSNDDFLSHLGEESVRLNTMGVVQLSEGGRILTFGNDNDMLRRLLWERLYAEGTDSEIIESTPAYTIQHSFEYRPKTEYLEIVGSLDSGEFCCIRTPLENIENVASISNIFLLYVGGAAIFIGCIAIWQVTRDRERLERERSEFLSNVSHELKTPIALIQGYAEGLADGMCDDESMRAHYAEVISGEADRMSGLVKQLMMLDRLEFDNDSKAAYERFNLIELIEKQLGKSQILMKTHQITSRLDCTGPVMVYADYAQVEVVFDNLLSNAINHCNGDDKRIVVNVTPSGSLARVSVYNTGDTIPEAELERIWEKFYKVDKARTRAYGGSGVGLSIVRSIQNRAHLGYGVVNRDNGVEFWYDVKMEVHNGANVDRH